MQLLILGPVFKRKPQSFCFKYLLRLGQPFTFYIQHLLQSKNEMWKKTVYRKAPRESRSRLKFISLFSTKLLKHFWISYLLCFNSTGRCFIFDHLTTHFRAVSHRQVGPFVCLLLPAAASPWDRTKILIWFDFYLIHEQKWNNTQICFTNIQIQYTHSGWGSNPITVKIRVFFLHLKYLFSTFM